MILGSGWAEYKKTQTVHGIPLPPGLVESQRLPEPIFTPSTKAEQGQHDENISPQEGAHTFLTRSLLFAHNMRLAAEIVGQDLCDKISTASLALYKAAAAHAESKGIILADSKFEFGLVPSSTDPSREELILVDELLTPDSSRYWPADSYEPGKGQPSFDKQYLRDWLVQAGFRKGLESGPEGKQGEGWVIEEKVVDGTRQRYEEVVKLLTS